MKGKKEFIRVTELNKYGYRDSNYETGVLASVNRGREYCTVSYLDGGDDPNNPSSVSVKVKNDGSCAIIRDSGDSIKSHGLFIQPQKRNFCDYQSENGSLMLGINGHDVLYDPASGNINISYDIDVNGTVTSRHRLRIEF